MKLPFKILHKLAQLPLIRKVFRPLSSPYSTSHIRRLHPRYGSFAGIVHFYHPVLGFIDIENISYGGARLAEVDERKMTSCLDTRGVLNGELYFLNEKIPCSLKPVHMNDGGAGCQFATHEDEIKEFLSSYLEPYQLGSTLSLQEKGDGHYHSEKCALSVNATSLALHLHDGRHRTELLLIIKSPEIVDFCGLHHDDGSELAMLLCLLLGFESLHPSASTSRYVKALVDYFQNGSEDDLYYRTG
jgi:hypothetical protein